MGHPADDAAAHSLNYCHTSQSVCSAQPQVGNKLVNHCQWCSSKTLYTEISLKLFFIIVCPFSMGRIHFLLKWGQQRGWKEDEGLISWCPVWNIQYILFSQVRITLFFPFFTPHDSPHHNTPNTFSNSLSLSRKPLQGTKTLYPTRKDVLGMDRCVASLMLTLIQAPNQPQVWLAHKFQVSTLQTRNCLGSNPQLHLHQALWL